MTGISLTSTAKQSKMPGQRMRDVLGQTHRYTDTQICQWSMVHPWEHPWVYPMRARSRYLVQLLANRLPGTRNWRLVPGTGYQAPGTRYLVPVTGTWYQAPGTRYQEPGPAHQVPSIPGVTHQVPAPWCHVPGTSSRHQAPGTRYQAPWPSAPGTWYTWCHVPGIPAPWCHVPGASSRCLTGA
jgi:hypothetical protein